MDALAMNRLYKQVNVMKQHAQDVRYNINIKISYYDVPPQIIIHSKFRITYNFTQSKQFPPQHHLQFLRMPHHPHTSMHPQCCSIRPSCTHNQQCDEPFDK